MFTFFDAIFFLYPNSFLSNFFISLKGVVSSIFPENYIGNYHLYSSPICPRNIFNLGPYARLFFAPEALF